LPILLYIVLSNVEVLICSTMFSTSANAVNNYLCLYHCFMFTEG